MIEVPYWLLIVLVAHPIVSVPIGVWFGVRSAIRKHERELADRRPLAPAHYDERGNWVPPGGYSGRERLP